MSSSPTAIPSTGASPLPDPLLFLGGAPRSGTTLVRNMLAAHPLLAVPDESYFVHDVRQVLGERDRADDVGMAWQLIRDHRFFKGWQLDAADVEQALRFRPAGSYADLVRTLFAVFAQSRHRPSSADKTPSNSLHFDWLAAAFPGSVLVHLVRDPREVCMSLALKQWNQWGVPGAAVEWVKHASPALASAPRLGLRYLEVRYEEIVRSPAAELGRICEAAGIPFDAAMLRYSESADLLPDRHHSRARQAPFADARRWQHELNRDDLAVIEAICGQVMDRLGYPRASPRRHAARGAVLAARHRAVEIGDWWVRKQAPVLAKRLASARRWGPRAP